jgi:predicted adenine nucleotide alpha hydrolase (AANH) superfamily ATPase
MPNHDGIYICNGCSYETTVRQNFNKHNKGKKHLETSKLNGFYACNYCGLAFDTENKKFYYMRSCEKNIN